MDEGELVCPHCGSLVAELSDDGEVTEDSPTRSRFGGVPLSRTYLAAIGAALALAVIGGGIAAYLAYDQGARIDELENDLTELKRENATLARQALVSSRKLLAANRRADAEYDRGYRAGLKRVGQLRGQFAAENPFRRFAWTPGWYVVGIAPARDPKEKFEVPYRVRLQRCELMFVARDGAIHRRSDRAC